MVFYMAIAALLTGIAAGSCASKTDAVAATTGESDPQARMAPQDLEQLMQKIGPTYSSLRKNLQGGDTGAAGKQAQQLAELFGGVEKFWTQHNRPDAVKWAGQARTTASESAGSAVGGDAAKAAAAAENMGAACKQCHGTYRESDGQGGYRIKPGVLQ
jgi:cytochrome c556